MWESGTITIYSSATHFICSLANQRVQHLTQYPLTPLDTPHTHLTRNPSTNAAMAWYAPPPCHLSPTSSKAGNQHVQELALASLSHPVSTTRTRAPSPARTRHCTAARHAVEHPAGMHTPRPPRPTGARPRRGRPPARAPHSPLPPRTRQIRKSVV